MIYFIQSNEHNKIIAVISASFEDGYSPTNGFYVDTELTAEQILNECVVDNNQIIRVGLPLSYYHEFDIVNSAWVVSADGRARLENDLKFKIDSLRQKKSLEPISYIDNVFDADEAAIKNITTWQIQLLAGVPLPDNFVWRDYNNQDHLIGSGSEFINGLAAAITLRGTELYKSAWIKKAEIENLSVDDLLTYDVEAGW